MKQTMFVVILFAIGSITKAQNFSIGPTAGFGHSWLTNNNDVAAKFYPSWNAGLAFIYSTKKNFGIGADIKFSTEGNKITYTAAPNDLPQTVTQTLNIDYIRIPVKFIYFFGKKENLIYPKIYAGPDIGFITSGHIVQKFSSIKYKSGIESYYKILDVGFTVAAGLNFKLARATWLNTDIVYYNGLPDISKTNSNNHNKNVEINIGLLVGLKKK